MADSSEYCAKAGSRTFGGIAAGCRAAFAPAAQRFTASIAHGEPRSGRRPPGRAHGNTKRIAGASTNLPISTRSTGLYIKPGMASERKTYGFDDVKPGDWIRYRSGYYGSGRLAEVHAIAIDVHSGPYAVTTEGNVLFSRILEIRRRPINVVALPPRK